MIKLFCCISSDDFDMLNLYTNINNKTIISEKPTNDIDVAIVDISLESSKEFLNTLEKLSREQKTSIIFINFDNEYFEKISKFQFVKIFNKDCERDYIITNINSILKFISQKEDIKLVKLFSNRKEIYIKHENIIFIESGRNKTLIHTDYEVLECKAIKISDCKNALSDCFVKCHKKFAINKSYVNKVNISEKIVYLNNGQIKVSIGRAYKDHLLYDLGLE